ncbi:MAG: mechanosensitive ion channel [Planctomycetes bacterium]|nr:mechanosensitive ion channel [Planctomycetota bacterium]
MFASRSILLGAALCAVFLGPGSRAQEPLPAAELEKRLQRVETQPGLEEALRGKIVTAWREALAAARRHEELQAERVRLAALVASAPRRIEELKREAEAATQPSAPATEGLRIAELDQERTKAQGEWNAARAELDRIDTELKERNERRTRQGEQLGVLRTQIGKLEEEGKRVPPPDEPTAWTEARAAEVAARRAAAAAETELLQAELAGFEVRGELLRLQRDALARRVAAAERAFNTYSEALTRAREAEARQQAESAQEARRQAARAHPVVQAVAAENQALAERRAGPRGMVARLALAQAERQELASRLSDLRDGFERLQKQSEVAGLSRTLAILLRKSLAELPDQRSIAQRLAQHQADLAETQVEQIALQQQAEELSDIPARQAVLVAGLDPAVSEVARVAIAFSVEELLEARRALVQQLIGDQEAYFNVLVDLVQAESEILRQVRAILRFVDERLLWTPTGYSVLGLDWGGSLLQRPECFSSDEIEAALGWLRDEAFVRAWRLLLVLVVAVGLLLPRRRTVLALDRLGTEASRAAVTAFLPTTQALLLSLYLASIGPALLLAASWFCLDELAPRMVRAVGAGFATGALSWAGLAVLRQITRENGLAMMHFGWPVRASRQIRAVSGVMIATLVPLSAAAATLTNAELDPRRDGLHRLVLISIMVLAALYLHRVLRPRGGILDEYLTRHPRAVLARLRPVYHGLAIVVPLVGVGLVTTGYVYTALQISRRFQGSVQAVVGMTLLHALFMRWLLLARRRMAIEALRKQRETAAAARAGQREGPAGEAPVPEAPAVDLGTISAQSRRLLAALLTAATFLVLWGIWADLLPALGLLDDVHLWSTTVTESREVAGPTGSRMETLQHIVPVSLGDVLLAMVLGFLVALAARNLPALVEIAVLDRMGLPTGERYAITTVLRYAIVIVGTIVVFAAIGIGWSQVQWLAAAVSLGLGFGLQEIFANFVSGLILLFERPVRVGDIVTVGEIEGVVSQIRMRSTVVVDYDRRELIIPNRELITGRVLNWTLSDTKARLQVVIGVAYGSDVAKVLKVLLDVARQEALVLREPEPSAVLRTFGENAIEFRLYAFVAHRDHTMRAVHSMNVAIERAFREHGIEIAFPQRDVRIRGIEGELRVVRAPREAEKT